VAVRTNALCSGSAAMASVFPEFLHRRKQNLPWIVRRQGKIRENTEKIARLGTIGAASIENGIAMARLSIGLALGSGIARGWAHLGVLRALNAAGIEPSIICGTSIGAVVGGFYAAGKLEALEEWVGGLSRFRLARYLDVHFGGGGLLAGRRLTSLLEDRLEGATIESLETRFACVATELGTGHEVWLQEGSLVDAIRASYALPGIFSPVAIDGQLLLDGALVNPVPVSVCRALGARLVIAVNLNADIFSKHRAPIPSEGEVKNLAPDNGEALALIANAQPIKTFAYASPTRKTASPGMFGVMVSSLGIIQDRLSRSRLAGDPPDVVIAPRLGQIGLLEFHRAEESIAEGQASVARSLPFLAEALNVLAPAEAGRPLALAR
jgi:NTE family protein